MIGTSVLLNELLQAGDSDSDTYSKRGAESSVIGSLTLLPQFTEYQTGLAAAVNGPLTLWTSSVN